MKPLTASRLHVFGRTALTVATLALVSCAAEDLTTHEQEVAPLSKAVSTRSAAPNGEQQWAGDASPYVLFLEDANGNAFELLYSPGYGWKYVAGPKSEGGAIPKVEFSPLAASHAETTAPPIDDPMAVFIDGPTGNTFTWSRDTGWEFVGRISHRHH